MDTNNLPQRQMTLQEKKQFLMHKYTKRDYKIEDLQPKYAVMFCPSIEKVQTWTLLHMCNTIEEAKQEILWRLSYMKTNDGDLVVDNDGRFSTWRDETKNTNEHGLVHEPTDQDINLNYNAGSMLQVIADSNNQQQNGFRGMAYYGGIEIGNYQGFYKIEEIYEI